MNKKFFWSGAKFLLDVLIVSDCEYFIICSVDLLNYSNV